LISVQNVMEFNNEDSKINKHFIHSTIDIGSGFILAILIQIYIFPYFDLYPEVWDMVHISLIFTVVSIARSTLWRRFFNKGE